MTTPASRPLPHDDLDLGDGRLLLFKGQIWRRGVLCSTFQCESGLTVVVSLVSAESGEMLQRISLGYPTCSPLLSDLLAVAASLSGDRPTRIVPPDGLLTPQQPGVICLCEEVSEPPFPRNKRRAEIVPSGLAAPLADAASVPGLK